MELRNIRTFLHIVETGSFTQTAKDLGYTQSTVSFQIRQLEEELGCQLFDRIGRKVVLTDKGELLLRHSLDINHSIHDMLEDFLQEGKPSGLVRIVSADSICERMMLLNYHEFYETYPDIRLIFSTGSTIDMMRTLDRNEADVIFTLDNHVYEPDYVIARESPVQLHFVTNPAHPLASRQHIDIQEVLDYPLYLTESGMTYRKILDDKLAELSLKTTPVLETGRADILAKSAESGPGIAFLPDFVSAPFLEKEKLVHLNVDQFDLTIWKQLIYRKDKWVSRALSAFVEFVVEHEFLW